MAAARHPRDPAATKERLLRAALAEFAEHGLAGARVDRIADRAETNKRMIYAYYGDKDTLFETVLDRCGTAFNEAVAFSADDLPAYAGAYFDRLAADPVLADVLARRDLERAQPTPLEEEAYQERVAAIERAQADGTVRAGMPAVDVLAFVEALARSWLRAGVGVRASGGPDTPARRRAHRAALVDAVRRVTSPTATSAQSTSGPRS